MRSRVLVFSLMCLSAWLATGDRPHTLEGPEVRAFWVDAFNAGIKTQAEVDQLISRALAANANTLIAQVRRRGDSYYLDSLEPFVEDPAVTSGFDPLGYVIERAHANGLEVHAWVAANAIYSGNPAVATATWPCKVPCSPSHVFNRHGYFAPGDENWLTRTHPSFTAGTVAVTSGGVTIVPAGWRISDGNWWLDPGHPAAAAHIVQVLRHLVERYDVDGLHLDRIRYPEMPIARPAPGGPIGFSTGYNTVSVRRFNEVYGRPAGSLPNPWDPAWNEWRREQMNALVRRIYLETIAVKPHVKVSASTITFFRGPTALGGFSRTEAYSRVYQDWDGWTRQGVLDLNVPMVYKRETDVEGPTQFNDWTDFTRTHQYDRHAAIGIGVYLNSFEASIAQLERSRLASASGERAAGQALYSYATTNRSIGVPPVPERPYTEFFRALGEDGAYVPVAPYNTAASIPPMPWKSQPREGYLLARVVDASGAPEDGAVVVIRKVGGGPADVQVQQYADGNGYIGAASLAPGAYQLEITTPEGTTYFTVPEPVTPGRVTRLTVTLGSRARGPMVRAERSVEPDTRADEEFSALEAWRAREPHADDVVCEQPECR
jgi:uncharacterized lipoprotein YddW (UPF0748 family)